MQILRDMYQVGGSLNGITHVSEDSRYEDCNTYVLNTPEGIIMIDCGCGLTIDLIYSNMRYWSLDPNKIKACIITHPHLDHAGGAYLLSRNGIKIYSHHNTSLAMEAGDERCCGYLYHRRFTPVKTDVVLNDMEEFNILGIDFTLIHLPGHTGGCSAISFKWQDKKIVASGDIIGTLLDGYFGWSGSIDFNKKDYLESLIRFSRYDFDIMIPGHGLIYMHKPRRRIEDALNRALTEWR